MYCFRSEKTTKNKTLILSLIEFMFKCTMKALHSNSLLNPITLFYLQHVTVKACTHLLTCLFSASSPLEGKLKECRDLAYFVHLHNNHGTYNGAWGRVSIQ